MRTCASARAAEQPVGVNLPLAVQGDVPAVDFATNFRDRGPPRSLKLVAKRGRAPSSFGGEGGEEGVEVLLLAVLRPLQLLDLRLILLDLRLLAVELVQVALVRLGRARHLPQVGTQPRLVRRQRVQLPLL